MRPWAPAAFQQQRFGKIRAALSGDPGGQRRLGRGASLLMVCRRVPGAGIVQVQSYRRQYGASYIAAMLTNLYGPGDNLDLETSHVLPALIRRFHEAKSNGADQVVLWSSGTPPREFLHVNDLAAACTVLLRRYDADEPVNVGCGQDLTIRELAETVRDVVGRPPPHVTVEPPPRIIGGQRRLVTDRPRPRAGASTAKPPAGERPLFKGTRTPPGEFSRPGPVVRSGAWCANGRYTRVFYQDDRPGGLCVPVVMPVRTGMSERSRVSPSRWTRGTAVGWAVTGMGRPSHCSLPKA